MGGRREVSILTHRPVTSSDLKQERLFFHEKWLNIFATGCSSNCLGKQRHWVILEEQFHKKVSLNNKKSLHSFSLATSLRQQFDSQGLLIRYLPCFLVLTNKPTTGTLAQPYALLETLLQICRILMALLYFLYVVTTLSELLDLFSNHQGRVVRKPVSANPGLNFNPGFFIFLS